MTTYLRRFLAMTVHLFERDSSFDIQRILIKSIFQSFIILQMYHGVERTTNDTFAINPTTLYLNSSAAIKIGRTRVYGSISTINVVHY